MRGHLSPRKSGYGSDSVATSQGARKTLSNSFAVNLPADGQHRLRAHEQSRSICRHVVPASDRDSASFPAAISFQWPRHGRNQIGSKTLKTHEYT